ncbi:MAG: Hsp70 family protein [Deltaproteobacteria bacterium]|nr:Hsp70 family protein [Deltaproteobacteria bacterium]
MVTEVTSGLGERGMGLDMTWEIEALPLLDWVVRRASGLAPTSAEPPLAPAEPPPAPAEPPPAAHKARVKASIDIAIEPPVEEDGTLSEDLLEVVAAVGPVPEAHPEAAAEPLLLVDVVEEAAGSSATEDMGSRAGGAVPPLSAGLRPAARAASEYAFSGGGARDQLGPAPAPPDALAAADVPARPILDRPLSERVPGEVTPLARVDLVRKTPLVVQGVLVSPPPSAASTAIPSKRDKAPLPDPSRLALGVDPGNQTTRVAVVEAGKARILQCRRGGDGFPSAVFMEPKGRTIVGEPAARRLVWQPELGLRGTGRLLGRMFCSPRVEAMKASLPYRLGAAEEDEVALNIGEHFISLEEVQALILKEARATADLSLGDAVNRAVLTCPASWGVRQRMALRIAGKLAGLHVARILSAPLAVVLGELMEERLGLGTYLVYDFGAGVFDCAVVRVGPHSAQLLAAGGGPGLGGVELDQALAERLVEEVERAYGHPPSPEGRNELLDAVEAAKRALSTDAATRVHLTGVGPDVAVEVEILRGEAEALFTPIVERSFDVVKDVLRQAGLEADGLDGVLMVGGQSRIPLVRRRAEQVLGDRMLVVDPAHAVVRGAAWAAAQLESTAPYNLFEILPEPLSVGRDQGRTETLLEAGVVCPTQARFEHVVRGPHDLELFLFQGVHGRVEQDEPVARLRLAPPEGVEFPWAVDMELDLNEQGSLRCAAQDRDSGIPVRVTDVKECSRALIRAHFERAPEAKPPGAATPGFFDRLIRALKQQKDEAAS